MSAVEVGPQGVEEDHLGIGRLPEQEVRGALLPRRADKEVDVGHGRLAQVPGNGSLVDPRRLELPRRDLLSDADDRIGDLGPTAVIDAEIEREPGVVPSHLLSDLKLVDH